MPKPPQNLEDVRCKIEQSLAENQVYDVKPEPVQLPPKQSSGDPSSAVAAVGRLTDACNKTANDIQETGQTIVNVAAGIAAETDALAELLRKHGAAIAARIDEFTALTKRVAGAVEAARADVDGVSTPPLTPNL
jgi:hypothetical protein